MSVAMPSMAQPTLGASSAVAGSLVQSCFFSVNSGLSSDSLCKSCTPVEPSLYSLYSCSILTPSLLHDDLRDCIQVHRQLVLSCGQRRRSNRLDLVLSH